MNASRFIACGMYAPNSETRKAWQALFNHFYPLIDLDGPFERRVRFEFGESVLRDPWLIIGHTCGYPLMTRLQDALRPFCVPCFEVPGTAGIHYSSRFIVPADSAIETLQQCHGKIVAINDSNSNSGMNVLRYALAKSGARPGYFSDVLITGGHLASVEAVAVNRAQLAAIDCVSFQLIADRNPGLISALRVIGYSEQTCGLPFVVPAAGYSHRACESIVSALNRALTHLPAEQRATLHLAGFESVGLEDYRSILALEEFAVEAGYAELN